MQPTPQCASVVYEYLYPQDLSAYHTAPQPQLASTYDDWIASQQGTSLPAAFKIVFPRDGDVFARYPARGEFVAEPQALQFQTSLGDGGVRWFLNRRSIASQQSAPVLWRLLPGTWRLRAVHGSDHDEVTFRVIQASRRTLRRGFSLANSR